MVRTLTPPLTPFVDPLPLPPRLIPAHHDGRLSLTLRAGTHRFHRELPKTPIWGYEGIFPGPTIEAERGQPVTITWRNELNPPFPVVVARTRRERDMDGVPVLCLPNCSDADVNEDVAALAGHAVVHLHGGLTPASSDGWTENLCAPGQTALFTYPMNQRAALLWYHDHVMSVTRYQVYAGLAGLWIIREPRERDCGLPEGPPFEIPLLIQDRNFVLDVGSRRGWLLHKTGPDVMEAFAPFTVVNGCVWPLLDIQPAIYRFRVINGSNARTYRLVLVRNGRPEFDRISQIGTDHGLLRHRCDLPADGLILAPAERADLLVDFSDLEVGAELTFLNTALAPFNGSPYDASNAVNARSLGGLLPYPEVMRIRVQKAAPARWTPPPELAADLTEPTFEDLHKATRRTIVLVERRVENAPNMLTMRELGSAEDAFSGKPVVTIIDGEHTSRRCVIAAHFEDSTNFFPTLHRYEVWQFINLTTDTHPIHVHLDPFVIVSRRPIRFEIPEGGIEDLSLSAVITIERGPDDVLAHTIDDNERGLKDTVRVNPNEMVEIAVRFTSYSGRYMYHCHILEHEDRDMMRPFVTVPPELVPFMS